MNRLCTYAVVATFAAISWTAGLSAQEQCSKPRVISVTGTAEVQVAPDEVTLRFGSESEDKDLNIAKAMHDKRMKKIIAVAREAGVEAKDLQTSALRIGPDYSEEKVPKLLGYEVSQSLSITLRDLSKYERLMTDLLLAGVNRVDGVDFTVRDAKKYREESRAKALKAAKEKAIAMANEVGQTIGKPWEITEYVPSYGGGLANNYSSNFSTERALVQEDQSTVAPGQVSIRSSVRVSFQLE